MGARLTAVKSNAHLNQSPSRKSNSSSAAKKFAAICGSPKPTYRVYNSLPLEPILSQMNPVNILSLMFTIPNFSIIFSYKASSSKRSPPFRCSKYCLFVLCIVCSIYCLFVLCIVYSMYCLFVLCIVYLFYALFLFYVLFIVYYKK